MGYMMSPGGGRAEPHPAIVREINRWSRASWAIDPALQLVVAANAAGLGILGMTVDSGCSLPVPVGSPAFAGLADIAADLKPGEGRPARFDFGSHDARRPLDCDVYRLTDAPELLIVAVNEDYARPAQLPLADPERDPRQVAQSAARREREDAETLAEIARRIREGQAELRRAGSHPRHTTRAGSAPGDETHRKRAGPSGASREARLAHELRTPLSAIMAAAEIMKDERFGPLGDARYRGYAADIQETARHALGVINAMLGALASVEPVRKNDERQHDERQHDERQLQLQFQFAEIDPGVIAASVVSSMQPLAAEAGLSLRLDAGERLPHVIADAVSVRQMLLNLLTNAMKFTERGGRVTVSLRYQPDAPLFIEVRDNGRGMSAAQLAHARGLRQRSHEAGQKNSAFGETPGLGIGLTIVRTLAAANGAEVDIESTAGEGTTARIAFGRDRLVPV